MKEIYGNSFGNLISAYWTIRAYSIYNQIDFNFKEYLKINNNYHESYPTILKNLFRNFKFNIKYEQNYDKYKKNFNSLIIINDKYSCELLKIKNNIDINKFVENKHNRLLLYFSHSYIGSWSNIIELIQLESERNINSYLKGLNIKLPEYNDNETVIHFRCGNVLIGNANDNYNILKFRYYKDNISKNCKKITIIWKIDYISKKTNMEVGSYNRDLFIISEFKKYLETSLNIEVNINNDYFSDFIYMMYAPKLIISPSTFSFWPSIMSKKEAVLPKCNLLCGNSNPFIRDNLYWIDTTNYTITASEIFKSTNNMLLNKLLE